MTSLSDEVLEQIERSHPEGITSQAIVTVLAEHGVPFTEAALRKYVQLGLLPHSVRVGRKGSGRGSQGVYPASIVRQAVEIKRLLGEGWTIEEISQTFSQLRGKITDLERQLKQLFAGIEDALRSRPEDTLLEHARRDLREAKVTAGMLLENLGALERRLSVRPRMVRVAG